MAFEFTMIDKTLIKTVECSISTTALDQLDGTKGTKAAGREAQFLRLRDRIERIASDIFDDGTQATDAVRIFFHLVR